MSYTPKFSNEIIFESDTERHKIEDIITGQITMPQHRGKNGILLHGVFGAGKTTLAELLPMELEKNKSGDILRDRRFIPCQLGNNGATLMTSMSNQIKLISVNSSGCHYVILDEVDSLTPAAQKLLKSIMNLPNVIFVMTTNHLQDIDEGIIDRSICVSFNAAPPEAWLPLARKMLHDNLISDVDDNKLISIFKLCNGSARNVRNGVDRIIANRLRQNTGISLS